MTSHEGHFKPNAPMILTTQKGWLSYSNCRPKLIIFLNEYEELSNISKCAIDCYPQQTQVMCKVTILNNPNNVNGITCMLKVF